MVDTGDGDALVDGGAFGSAGLTAAAFASDVLLAPVVPADLAGAEVVDREVKDAVDDASRTARVPEIVAEVSAEAGCRDPSTRSARVSVLVLRGADGRDDLSRSSRVAVAMDVGVDTSRLSRVPGAADCGPLEIPESRTREAAGAFGGVFGAATAFGETTEARSALPEAFAGGAFGVDGSFGVVAFALASGRSATLARDAPGPLRDAVWTGSEVLPSPAEPRLPRSRSSREPEWAAEDVEGPSRTSLG